MEEVLIVVLQLLAEFAFELATSCGLDLLSYVLGPKGPGKNEGCVWGFLMATLGAGIAALVNIFHPRVFLPQAWMRIVMLVAAPVIAGFASKTLAEQREEVRIAQEGGLHFWRTFCFVLAFEFVRFCWASRT